MIDDISIDLWSSKNFVSIKNIRIKCNSTVDLSKLIFNKKKIVKFISGWREFYMFYSIVIQKILDPLISKLLIEKGRKTKQKKKKKKE